MQNRLSIDRPLSGLMANLVASAPKQLGAIDVDRVLVVAAAARKAAHASVRALSFGGHPPRYESEDGRLHKPRVVMSGTEMLYEIALRPRFFIDTTAIERVQILAHELFHVGPRFDGRLDDERKHAHAKADEIERAVEDILGSWRAAGEPGLAAVSSDAEVTVSAWLERPPTRLLSPDRERRLYTERDLYPAIVFFSR